MGWMAMRILEEGEEDWKDRERERERGRMLERMSGIGWRGRYLLFWMDMDFGVEVNSNYLWLKIEIYRKIMVESISIRMRMLWELDLIDFF